MTLPLKITLGKTIIKPETGATLSELLNASQRFLIFRHFGGLGDIIMMRMMFETIKKALGSNINLHFCCPSQYLEAVDDHPFLDGCFANDGMTPEIFATSYAGVIDISSACLKHEEQYRRDVHLNRSDIWASEVKLELENHESHVCLTDEMIESARQKFKNAYPDAEKFMLLAPRSADPRRHLEDEHIQWVIDWCKEQNIGVLLIHNQPLPAFPGLPLVKVTSPRNMFSLCAAADWCVSTDTGPLHAAGAVGLPILGAFGYTNAKVVMEHYSPRVELTPSVKRLPCAPCYEWNACPYIKADKGRLPLRCMRDYTHEDWIEKLEELIKFEHGCRYRTVPTIKSCKLSGPPRLNRGGPEKIKR